MDIMEDDDETYSEEQSLVNHQSMSSISTKKFPSPDMEPIREDDEKLVMTGIPVTDFLSRKESLASIASRSQEHNRCNFVINHEGRFKIIWDWIILLMVIYTAIYIPFVAAFSLKLGIILSVNKVTGPESYAINILSALIDFMFILDIVINFRTTFLNSSSDEIVRDQKLLAIHYLKRWFVIDLLAAIPFDWIMYEKSADGGPTSTLIGLLKSARLLRLFQVARKVDRYSEYGLAVLFLLMCLFTLISHWLACVWNAISLSEEDNPNSWVRRLDKNLYGDHVGNFTGIRINTSQRYIASLYFIVSSLTSVGFGNVAATTQLEQIFSVIVMLLGALMYACIFGNMVAIIQRLYSKAANFHSHMSTVKEFLKFYKISEDLRNTINNYVRREWTASQGVDVEAVLRRFPDCIQADVTYELYFRIFLNVKPFKNATVCVIRALSMKFKTMTLQANNYAIRQGEEINRLYILGKGSLDILINGDLVDLLAKYSIFGYDFLKQPKKPKSNANVRAASSVEIHYIHKDDMLEILNMYPKFAKSFRETLNIGFDLNDENEEGSVRMTPRKEKIHITAVAKSALAMPIMAKWTKASRNKHNNINNNNNSTFENGRKKASSENDLDDRPRLNGDLVREQSYSTDNIAMKYKDSLAPKSIIKSQTHFDDESNPVSLNSNSVRFSMETLDEEARTYKDSDLNSEVVIETLQSQMRTLENDVREFKDALNDKITNIMILLQDIKNQNLPPMDFQQPKFAQENSADFDTGDDIITSNNDHESIASVDVIPSNDVRQPHSFVDLAEPDEVVVETNRV